MPDLRKCKNTGAVLFRYTPEEKEARLIKEELKRLREEVESIKVKIKDISTK